MQSIPPTSSHVATWLIAGIAILGVIVRPARVSEAVWAVLGALTLVLFSLLSVADAVAAVRAGTDVYLFLTGMMVLAELARREGLFDWLAAYAVRAARGSASRLFALIYAVGILVTVFLSNDATAVVLTPAVYAATKDAGAPPLPYLLICAFIANAASFVLPISNPANLVVYGASLPPLTRWLAQFAIPSGASIVATYFLLRLTQRAELGGTIAHKVAVPPLTPAGRVAAGGIAATAVLLSVSSARGGALGLPTFLAGAAAWIAVMLVHRAAPWAVFKGVSWSVLPLVAGLFVLVKGVDDTGVLAPLIHILPARAHAAPNATAFAAGALAALASNLVNNLPLGLAAGHLASAAQLSPHLTGALLVGVDLGPNLSVTGSLATILWLLALRREGVHVGGWRFLKLGSLIMPLALTAALLSFVLVKAL